MKIVAVNGSPRLGKGNTALLLNSFIEGMEDAGAEVELFYASRMTIKPCGCGSMRCWYATPGECPMRDDLEWLYPKLKAADALVLATPVYIPLPGAMQNLLNRLCPLIEPYLDFPHGRTRARLREDVHFRKIVLVSTSGWWELGNFDTVVRIVQELAEDASVEFAGALLRPHAFIMKADGALTPAGEAVLAAARSAGDELIHEGRMNPHTLDAISRPLISEEALRERYNRWI